MNLSGHERYRLARIERELTLDAPRLARAFARWSAGPLPAARSGAAVRAVVAERFRGVALSLLALGAGVLLLVLGVVDGWVAFALAGAVITEAAALLVACLVRRPKAKVPRRTRVTR